MKTNSNKTILVEPRHEETTFTLVFGLTPLFRNHNNSRQFAGSKCGRLRRSLHMFLIACLASLAVHLPLRVHAQSFLFENVATGNYPGSLTLSSSGQTMTVTPNGFPNGSVTVLQRDNPLSKGVIGNQGSTVVGGAFAPVRFTLSLPVSSITFGFEDATAGSGGDIDGSVTIQGFDSVGNLLGTMFYNNPTYDGGTYQTLSGVFSGASYFIASTSAPPDNQNSLVYEITASTPVVPEPSTWFTGLALCLSALLALRRRKRSI